MRVEKTRKPNCKILQLWMKDKYTPDETADNKKGGRSRRKRHQKSQPRDVPCSNGQQTGTIRQLGVRL